MRVVALCGSGNVGKTGTLKDLIGACYASGATKVASRANPASKSDVIEVFDYKGQRVCVSTGGDDVASINAGDSDATKYKCSVFVTASRGLLNCLPLARVCAIAARYGSYPILLSAYWEQKPVQAVAKAARIDALLRCI